VTWRCSGRSQHLRGRLPYRLPQHLLTQRRLGQRQEMGPNQELPMPQCRPAIPARLRRLRPCLRLPLCLPVPWCPSQGQNLSCLRSPGSTEISVFRNPAPLRISTARSTPRDRDNPKNYRVLSWPMPGSFSLCLSSCFFYLLSRAEYLFRSASSSEAARGACTPWSTI